MDMHHIHFNDLLCRPYILRPFSCISFTIYLLIYFSNIPLINRKIYPFERAFLDTNVL